MTPPAGIESQAARPAPTALVWTAFLVSGFLTTFLGPALPWLQQRFAFTDAEAGRLFGAQFSGSVLVTVVAGVALQRWGPRRSIGLGFAVMALSILALTGLGRSTALPALFGLGCGLGLAIPVTNLWVSGRAAGREKAATLNRLNFFWGLGAVLCPGFMTATSAAFGGLSPFLLAQATLAAGLACAAGLLLPTDHGGPEPAATHSSISIVLRGVPFALFFFLYVGIETAMGGWLASLMKRTSAGGWMWAPALFWGGLLAGRASAGRLLYDVSEKRLLSGGSMLAAVGIALVVGTEQPSFLLAGAFGTGLGLAPLFPTALALFEARLGREGLAVAGPLFALGVVGGAVLPWIVGVASSRAGALRVGLFVVLVSSLALVALTFGRFFEPVAGRASA